ncbi:MAG: caspase family protein [Paludibacteraceae bacterium]|nr:caspase family protein [Paludibacteraceae bacterium]
MKRRLFILLGLILSLLVANATKRALVIGVGNYPTGSGWAKINGDKDIPLVREILLANGFSTQNIVELVNEDATHDVIIKQVENLILKAQIGDVIYIHFSGHGQQVTDLNGDEEDGFDEAWIPVDAQFSFAKGKYEGENHILDDQLNQWLSKLRAKVGASGKVTVVADACHSGGGSRGDEDGDDEYVVRGTSDTFVIPGEHKSYKGETGASIDWIFISACKSYQCNYEYKGTGSLTYSLYTQKEKLSTEASQQVHRAIRSTISNIIPFTQTPVIEVTENGKQQSLF